MLKNVKYYCIYVVFVDYRFPFPANVLYWKWGMVGLAQLVRASDCGPEGRRFNSDIPPQVIASVVQRLVYKFSKLGMRVRFSPLAPTK